MPECAVGLGRPSCRESLSGLHFQMRKPKVAPPTSYPESLGGGRPQKLAGRLVPLGLVGV